MGPPRAYPRMCGNPGHQRLHFNRLYATHAEALGMALGYYIEQMHNANFAPEQPGEPG